jgi:hypothetical protein
MINADNRVQQPSTLLRVTTYIPQLHDQTVDDEITDTTGCTGTQALHQWHSSVNSTHSHVYNRLFSFANAAAAPPAPNIELSAVPAVPSPAAPTLCSVATTPPLTILAVLPPPNAIRLAADEPATIPLGANPRQVTPATSRGGPTTAPTVTTAAKLPTVMRVERFIEGEEECWSGDE